jgi:acetylornithine deacetylase/succinyl-diaminopimelate desuccinylase-like protein
VTVDAFAEAERLVDEFGPRPPGSDVERRAARHLAGRLEELGREADVETFAVWPAWATGYAINAAIAVIGSIVSVSSGTVGTVIVLLATVLTFLDLSGIAPTTRRLLGRRASQNVVSWGDRDKPGALLLVAHYDSAPTRTRPLRPLFLAMLVLLACCVLRAAGMSGTALTVLQFIPTAALIVYIALLLDVILSPAAPGENDNASGVAVVLRAAERLDDQLDYFGVHVLFTGSQKAMGQGMRAFLKAHRRDLADGDAAVLNIDAVGSGKLRLAKKEGPLLTAKSHPQLLGLVETETFVNREASDGYAASSAGVAATTLNADGARLEEEALADAEELVVELAEGLDEELSQP